MMDMQIREIERPALAGDPLDDESRPLRDRLPRTWYPILRSSRLARGRCLSVEFLGRPWVAFRDGQGHLGLVARYCSHMGADLSRGRVKDGKLECGLHRWRFDRQGGCPSLAAGAARDRARLASARIEEWAGIVFAHPAGEPAFRLQGLARGGAIGTAIDGADESRFFSPPAEIPVPFHWLLAAVNTFDVSHYGTIHHRRILGDPELSRRAPDHLGIRYSAAVVRRSWFDWVLYALGTNRVDVEIDCWGANLLVMRNLRTGFGFVIAVSPSGPEQARVFLSAFCGGGAGAGSGAQPGLVRRAALEIARRFGVSYLKEDIPYLRGMRPRPGCLLPGKDAAALAFWDYFRSLPEAEGR